jgi:glycosyltransferase involved in cell wall biosynthesis
MASGIPVVSTAVAGIPELIESECDGLLVPAGDPVALSGALKRLLADPELRERLAANARVKVEEKFSIDHSAENLMDLFASCAR